MNDITLRRIQDSDLELLFSIYASTRAEEMSYTNWGNDQIIQFLTMQFNLQHTQYMQNYENPSFDIILLNNQAVGRLYVNRLKDEIRIIDIAILPEFKFKGVGKYLMNELLIESLEKKIPISLHVEYNNAVLNWYERLGFKKIHENGVYYLMQRDYSITN